MKSHAVSNPNLPLVYSCSGCSPIAQLANRLALEFDREGLAQMSCIAGVGGGVPALVRKARSGRPILALDGCPLRCVQACLARIGVAATCGVTLTDCGFRKEQDFSEADVARLRLAIIERMSRVTASVEERT